MSPNIYLNASAHHASFIVFTLRSVPRLSRMWAGNYVGIFIPAITQTRDTEPRGREPREEPSETFPCPLSTVPGPRVSPPPHSHSASARRAASLNILYLARSRMGDGTEIGD